MPTATLSAVVYKPAAAGAVVFKGGASSTAAGVVHKARTVASSLAGAYSITAAVPAGAIQAEDDTYLMTESDDYIEAE